MSHISKESIKKFINTWNGRGYEKGESQSFWYQLLHDIFGIDNPAEFIEFEIPVQLKKKVKFIDALIPSTKVIIENKSSREDLRKAKKQSDNEYLTPYEQALRYSMGLAYSERPRWIVTCNFKSFLIYDMEKPKGEPFEILLENLEREYYLLRFLVEDVETTLRHEKAVSIKAGELIGKLYDELHKQYINPQSAESLRSLNILCVRLVFCLFAEDSGLFGENHGMFGNYMRSFKIPQMRKALIDLFLILNTPEEEREPYESESLLAFPYVNGGLFAEKDLEIPNFTPEIADILLDKCSDEFDWSGISPTIFGALFEDTMNPETRESGCMHYTSTENIHKVIDPLFLDGFRAEFNNAVKIKVKKTRKEALLKLQDKLASQTFLDPACGSGNFLTETYLSLRRLENEIMELVLNGERMLGGDLSPIKVSIEQFHGFEINDFAVTVAKAALWIAEAQMMRDTEHIVMHDLKFLPLKSYAHIEKLDALTSDWEEHVKTDKLSYIIGNPPFRGKKTRSQYQKQTLLTAIGSDCARPGNMDIVAGWFLKAARYIQKSGSTRVSFVATVNITRGEQVSLLWSPMLHKYGVKINYAYTPFVWNSESKKKAQVHCTIISFSKEETKDTILYKNKGVPVIATRLSPYLRDEETILVSSRQSPLCDIPKTGIGNKPIDGGFFLFKPDEKKEFVAQEPQAEKFFMQWYGAEEILNEKCRYFLSLSNCAPSELRQMPLSKKRIEAVRSFRKHSSDPATRHLSNFPTRFHVTNIPSSNFIVIPEVTSENREYIPMAFVTKEEAAHKLFSNLVKLMPNATFYHFGILQSSVHMIWTKGICGYKDFRPRYSTEIVFNNFPWPNVTDAAKAEIGRCAEHIIKVREAYEGSSLKELYDINTMPDDLRDAHLKNDAAVMKAYGFKENMTENEIVAKLLQKYKKKKEEKDGKEGHR